MLDHPPACSDKLTLSQHAQTNLKSVKGNTSHTSQSLHSQIDMQAVHRYCTGGKLRIAAAASAQFA